MSMARTLLKGIFFDWGGGVSKSGKEFIVDFIFQSCFIFHILFHFIFSPYFLSKYNLKIIYPYPFTIFLIVNLFIHVLQILLLISINI